MPTPTEVVKTLHENRGRLKANPNYSEADTVLYLIDPVLDFLGYPAPHQLRENQINKNRPDIVLWNTPYALRGTALANGILEAKPLNQDLEGKGLSRADRPKNQIKRYVNGYEYSGPGTYGILTDGNIWHMIQRGDIEGHTPLIKEWRLLDGTSEEAAACLEEIKNILKDSDLLTSVQSRSGNTKEARAICRAVAQGKSLAEVLQLFTKEANYESDLRGQAQLVGKAREAESGQWADYAFTTAGKIKVEQGDIAHEAVCVVVVKATDADSTDDEPLYREDAAIAASTFAKTVPLKMSVTLMIQPDRGGDPSAVRLAIHYQGHTGMTSEFNPNTPAPMTLKTLQKICDQLNKKSAVMAKTLTDAVGAKGVRDEFYKRIATGWTLRQQRKAKGNISQRHAFREAVLRHLIRTIFAWILKEEGNLPPEAFDEAFAKREALGNYHTEILGFLFHERLNKPESERKPHAKARIDKALSATRFLNGSLFARHRNDDILKLEDEDYFCNDTREPGLFTILSEYEWTASEHTSQSSDQTIDPEVLSKLFENLIAATRFGEEVPDRMPAGTYYTPSDIALEMVKDALAAAVRDQAPQSWKRRDLLDLFGDETAPLPLITAIECERLTVRIRKLTIFDPAVGSGEFPFVSTLAVRCALRKLGVSEDDADLTRDIISRQIFAQDINPMAVQVTRLRLFIAIMAAGASRQSKNDLPPLPNLEGKIICADTLGTVADHRWKPLGDGTLQVTMREVNDALLRVAQIREEWQTAHDEERKQELRTRDSEARAELRKATRGKLANQETVNFAKHPLLEPDAPPANTDPRLLFYSSDWSGFDVVIGNPPYGKVDPGKRKNLKQNKRFKTTEGNDLYNLIAEASLTLAKPAGGIITLIVPLSICFGQDQKQTRSLFESRCDRVTLRNQDIRPDKTFHDSPVEHPQNSQRTTIIVARTGESKCIIEVSGINKWRKSERHEYLTSRAIPLTRQGGPAVDPKVDTQWERVSTPEIQELINCMKTAGTRIRDLKQLGENPHSIGFPLSARYFITATPVGTLNRQEITFQIANEASLELALAAANSHAAYAWWKAFGDAFHVNPYEMGTIAIPTAWLEDRQTNERVRSLARELTKAINADNIKQITTGVRSTQQDSLNLHEAACETIREIDKLWVKGMGLTEEPLLSQLRVLRSDSTWRLGAYESVGT